MALRITELQRSYIEHFRITPPAKRMSKADAIEFLDYLRADEQAPFREDRIANLEQYLARLERSEAAEAERLRTEHEAANESCLLTEKWEALGATFRGLGSVYTIWEFGGREFYRWESGVQVVNEIVRKRAADETLERLLAEVAQ